MLLATGWRIGTGPGGFSEMVMNGIHPEWFVAVAMQYRLGALGLAPSKQIHHDGDLNVGLLDQLKFMRWVQKHIHMHGGDPKRLTIAGEGADVESALIHGTTCSGTRGTSLSSQIITSLPHLYKPARYDDNQVQSTFGRSATQTEYSPDKARNFSVMDCQRKAPISKINASSINTSMTGIFSSWAFSLVQDSSLLGGSPSRLLASKRVNGQCMLAGSNVEEGTEFVPQNLTDVPAVTDWLAALHSLMSSQDLQKAVNLHLLLDQAFEGNNVTFATDRVGHASLATVQSTSVGAQSLVDTFKAETTYICPSGWLADARSSSKSSSEHMPSWKYTKA